MGGRLRAEMTASDCVAENLRHADNPEAIQRDGAYMELL